MFSHASILSVVAGLALATTALPAQPPITTGADVAAAFARARAGEPLHYVALGGSITHAGKGWIGDWLHEQFPDSNITVTNAGMSGTGSSLGVFRIDRDVIAYQPDLVAIEYCVNDAGTSDADTIRYIESLVVRLKQLPHPPAIIIIEAASEDRLSLERHSRVAKHYGLLEVNMQQAVDRALSEEGMVWKDLFGDSVHPNKNGHALYAQTLEAALQPYLEMQAPSSAATTQLPAPLSALPLILDGRMVRLAGLSGIPGWQSQMSESYYWDGYFSGYLTADAPGTTLELEVTATEIGLHFPKRPEFGEFYAIIDGQIPRRIACNTPGSFGYPMLGKSLKPKRHRVQVVLPNDSNGPVKLGYLLLAGSEAHEKDTSPALSQQGPFTAERLRDLRFGPAFTSAEWAGPYAIDAGGDSDGRTGLAQTFAPETQDASTVNWQSITATNGAFDFAPGDVKPAPAVAYLRANIESPQSREALLAITLDYYARVWLNDELIATFDGPHGGASTPTLRSVQLRAGKNDLFVKTASGSRGHKLGVTLEGLPSSVQ